MSAESNLQSIAEQLFSVPPRQPGTVQLGLADCDAATAPDNEKTRVLFEILMELLLHGIHVKYGPDASPASLSVAQSEDIARYVLSYGFVLYIRSEELTVAPPVSRVPISALKDHCERFYDIDRGMWHEAFFDFAVITDRPGLQ